ncbi:hypothetical protein GQ53DRAFT_310576 [Thozetella sp. PMI_491]|nr:hypothetical protein GQ53DRAFT_310576 [Thozetella sp. PMI_491]
MDLPTTQGYSTHLRGAAMLMKASGPELHKTREGNEMWELAKTQILIFRQMPGAVLDDYSWLLDRNRNNPNISHTVNQMTMDRYAVRQETDRLARMPQTAEVVKELNEVLAKAQQLLAQMRRSPLEPLSEEPTEGINAIDDSKSRATTFPGTLSHFATFHSALIYLASMLSQVLLTTCIFRILAALHGPARYKSAKGYDDTVGIVTCCLRRIISATPFFLQWSGKDRFQMTSSPCGGGEAADESPMRGGIGSMIQWPLFVGFVSDFATREQKIYLRGRLRHLSEEIRVKQASAFLAVRRLLPASRSCLLGANIAADGTPCHTF